MTGSVLLKMPDNRSVWMTHDPITGSIINKSRKIIIVSHLDTQAESKKHPDETYFPPQKIFVVITRLERLKMENESTSVTTSAKL